jgi:vancomycin permeability regulator SanA
MRYAIAIASAALLAALATIYFSSPFASWVVSRYAFDSPDEVGDLHVAVFMGSNLAALVTGWLLGWLIGGVFARERRA